jgi:hypothetical protein
MKTLASPAMMSPKDAQRAYAPDGERAELT